MEDIESTVCQSDRRPACQNREAESSRRSDSSEADKQGLRRNHNHEKSPFCGRGIKPSKAVADLPIAAGSKTITAKRAGKVRSTLLYRRIGQRLIPTFAYAGATERAVFGDAYAKRIYLAQDGCGTHMPNGSRRCLHFRFFGLVHDGIRLLENPQLCILVPGA